ncbi:HNH endonuclease signature motif containing protein [Actinacidiphila glaucinigra]|uniref:HNH endonuclease signature motif containing protein n=1 Tax=Actinacidiphila glaucinigra TaxID=235986 RepID=UPI00382EBA03
MPLIRVGSFHPGVWVGSTFYGPGSEFEVPEATAAAFLAAGQGLIPADGDWRGTAPQPAPAEPKPAPGRPAPACPCDPGPKPHKAVRIAVCGVGGCGCQTWHINGRADRCRAHARSRADGSRYRDSHKSAAAADRRTAWAKLSARILRDRALCESPSCAAVAAPMRRAATEVDHIDGLGLEGPRWNDPTNLQALCHRCHSRKTASETFGN